MRITNFCRLITFFAIAVLQPDDASPQVKVLKGYTISTPMPVEQDGCKVGVQLTVELPDANDDKSVVLTVTFDNLKAEPAWLFNPSRNKLLPDPYLIAVYDETRQYFGIVPPPPTGGSRRGPIISDWTRLPHDSSLVVRKRIARSELKARTFTGEVVLLEGSYSFQVICGEMLLSAPRFDALGRIDVARFDILNTKDWKNDVGRSNLVQLALSRGTAEQLPTSNLPK